MNTNESMRILKREIACQQRRQADQQLFPAAAGIDPCSSCGELTRRHIATRARLVAVCGKCAVKP